MKTCRRTPGICRIDCAEKRTHGFSARVRRGGQLIAKFFADKRHGGRKRAFALAQAHYQKLLRKYGTMTRQKWAQLPRQKNRSGIVGVRRTVVERAGRQFVYWWAVWSPRPNVVRRQRVSQRTHGARRAKALAIRARKRGVRNMEA